MINIEEQMDVSKASLRKLKKFRKKLKKFPHNPEIKEKKQWVNKHIAKKQKEHGERANFEAAQRALALLKRLYT